MTQGIAIGTFYEYIQSINNATITGIASSLERLSLGLESRVEAAARIVDHLQARAGEHGRIALEYGEAARTAGNFQESQKWNQLAEKFAQSAESFQGERTIAALERHAAELKAALPERVAGVAGAVAAYIDIAQLFDAAERGDWPRVGEISSEILASEIFVAGLGVLFNLASFTPQGLVVRVVLYGAFAGVGYALGGEAWRNLWNSNHLLNNVAFDVANTFGLAKAWKLQRKDPMVLDLNNNGLEAIIPNSGYAVRFDHEGDGSKTGTGWISANDAFLVLDRNGNGVVDDGRELFGDNTPKNLDGTLALTLGKASNGFDALRQEDTNNDGVVDASDTRFADLRLWQDLNQDGISQANELSTLASKGITSLSLNSTANSQVTGGNRISDLGTYQRTITTTDPVTGAVTTSSVTATLGDIDLADQPFIRTFTNPLPVSAAAGALPDMQGSGWVRDLREAMSSSNGAPSFTPAGSAASDLVSAVSAFSAGTTRASQRAHLDNIVQNWALTTGQVKFDNLGSNIWYDVRPDGYGYKVRYATDPADPMMVYNFAGLTRIEAGTGTVRADFNTATNQYVYTLTPPVYTEGYEAMYAKLKVLEIFNAQPFVNPPRALATTDWTDKPGYVLRSDNEPTTPGSGLVANQTPVDYVFNVNLSQPQVDRLEERYVAAHQPLRPSLLRHSRPSRFGAERLVRGRCGVRCERQNQKCRRSERRSGRRSARCDHQRMALRAGFGVSL